MIPDEDRTAPPAHPPGASCRDPLANCLRRLPSEKHRPLFVFLAEYGCLANLLLTLAAGQVLVSRPSASPIRQPVSRRKRNRALSRRSRVESPTSAASVLASSSAVKTRRLRCGRRGPGVTAGAPTPSHRACGCSAHGAPMHGHARTVAVAGFAGAPRAESDAPGLLSPYVATLHGRPSPEPSRSSRAGWALRAAGVMSSPASTLRRPTTDS